MSRPCNILKLISTLKMPYFGPKKAKKKKENKKRPLNQIKLKAKIE